MVIFLSDLAEEEEIDNGPAVLPSYDDAEEDFLDELDDNLGVGNVRRSIDGEQYLKLDEQRLACVP
jgi:molybdenum cofactor sulfurtransferase